MQLLIRIGSMLGFGLNSSLRLSCHSVVNVTSRNWSSNVVRQFISLHTQLVISLLFSSIDDSMMARVNFD